jgi:hypothetical protein
MPIVCLKYNKMPQPYLKHTGRKKKKLRFAKTAF